MLSGGGGFAEAFNREPAPAVRFRVDAPVTRRTPRRSGCEDFPHPVPQCRRFSPGNRTGTTPFGAQLCHLSPALHTPPKSGYTVCGLCHVEWGRATL